MSAIPPEDWKKVEALFDEALEQAESQRESWLVDACNGDETLHKQVQSLLKAEAESSPQFDKPLPIAAGDLLAEGMVDPLLGQQLGSWKVCEEIGRGGMGVVYRAERIDGDFQQEAVIKVLRIGVDTVEARGRFLQERQILAKLAHPSIARLLDGGISEDGRPYIVLDYVDGVRIDLYCDEQTLSLKQRIRTFLSVVDAVDFAHRHLIVHRDIKPSNVLVDKEGNAQLLDFGIAKILDDDAVAMTMEGRHVMTPEYGSPEQVLRENITTASDVYQLGLLLYQLLTGQLPYPTRNKSPHEIGVNICQSDPTYPSAAVIKPEISRYLGEEDLIVAADISKNRNTSTSDLKKKLGGDLDRILLKALRKEPERRYLSAREFREDLHCFLDGDPVKARGDSFQYRAGRFFQKHWIETVALGIILLISVVFGTYHLSKIATERNKAEFEAERRQEVADFLVEMLRIPDSARSSKKDVTARELLAEAFEKTRTELTDPYTRIRMMKVVGEVSNNLGLLDQAASVLSEAVDLQRVLYGSRSLEVAETSSSLADVLSLDRKFADALPRAEEALSIYQEKLPEQCRENMLALRMVGMCYRQLRDPEKAEELIREALQIANVILPPDDVLLPSLQENLALVLRVQKKYEEAENIYRVSIANMRKLPDTDQKVLAGALNNLGFLMKTKENYAEAEIFYLEAVERMDRASGEAHPASLQFRSNYAAVLYNQGKIEETLAQYKKIMELQISLNGTEHWRTANRIRIYATFLMEVGRDKEALDLLADSCEIFRSTLDDDHLWTCATELQYAVLLLADGQLQAGEELLSHCSRILASDDSKADGMVTFVVKKLVEIMEERGRTDLVKICEEFQATSD